MADYSGPERRKYARINVNFVVSYRIKQAQGDFDLSQTKNMSQGGMLLTTNKEFSLGTHLAMFIRFPLIPHKIEVTGVVVGCKQIVRDIIYETRIQFLDLDQEFFVKLGEFIKRHLPHG